MSHPLPAGTWIRSPGAGFAYRVIAPVSRLYDRDELPWSCCSLAWKGKMPSWNRVGPRLVPDIAASRCPSYAVEAVDQWGCRWLQVLTLYHCRLTAAERHWWVTRKPVAAEYPEVPYVDSP